MKVLARLSGFALSVTLISCGGDAATTSSSTGGGSAASLTISPSSVSITALGGTVPMSLEARDASGKTVSVPLTWTSSSPNVASISASGIVTGHANGSAEVSAVYGSLRATASVVVSQTAASVVLTPQTLTFSAIGATQTLSASVRDAGGREMPAASIAWSSSDPSIASVSPNGVVTSLKSGATTIRADVQTVAGTAQVAVNGTSGPVTCTQPVAFTEFLVDPSLVKVVTQIGVIGGGNTSLVGRAYVMPKDGLDGQRLALTAPGAIKIVAAKHYVPSGAPAGYVPDWSLLLDAGCGVTVELYHAKDIAASIKAVADTTISSSSALAQLPTPVSFAAGETFGWYERGINAVAFDVVAHDSKQVNHFANQARYEAGRSNLLDIICPWSLFVPARRDAYLSLIGAPTGQRVPGAGCGTVERDVAGTPAGQWFLSPTITETFPFGKTGNYGDPLPIILGIDNTVYIGHTGPSDDIRIDPNNPTWKDPATITTSWCYRQDMSASGWLWLRMVSATQMDVAYGGSGSCPASFPSSGFVSYYR